MSRLGLVAAGKRDIRPGYSYDRYFPHPQVKDEIVKKNGTVRDTVNMMDKIVRSTLSDTALISPLLKGKTIDETCRNIWNFLYHHVQYRLDKPGLEELRRPSRSWYDRKKGVDCDDFAILASSILLNNGIAHKFRVTKYSGDWQHVYVAVPASKKEYIIDCVLDTYDYEKPYTDKFDHTMTAINGLGIPIAYLSGFGEMDAIIPASLRGIDDGGLLGIITGADLEINFEGLGALGFTGKDLEKLAMDKIYDHLIRTRDYIIRNPHSVLTSGGVNTNLKMLNYAIDNWNTPNRDHALSVLEKEEQKWNLQSGSVSGMDDEEISVSGLGKISLKKMWGGVKKAVTKVKEVAKKIGTAVVKTASKIGKAISKGVTSVIKKVAEYNPLSIAARTGYLAAMRINMFQFAKKLAPGYLTLADAKNKGYSEAQWNKGVKALAKAKHVYTKILYGNEGKLDAAIKKGAGLSGLGYYDELQGLGEPVMVSIIAAASPLVAVAEALSGTEQDALGCCMMHGLGEGEIQAQAGEKKTGLISRFIGLIKKWFGKKKDEGQDFSNQQTTASDSDAGSQSAPNGGGELVQSSENSTAMKNMDESGGSSQGGSGGGFAKIKQWVLDNPGKTALGVAGIGIAGYFIFKPKKQGHSGTNLSGLKPIKNHHRKPNSIILK